MNHNVPEPPVLKSGSLNYYSNIRRSLQYIENHLLYELTLLGIAKAACFSPYHFHRIFNGMVGVSVMEYVRRRRLSCAALRLIKCKQSVLDVALDFQYGSAEAFSRAFKREFGMSPDRFSKESSQVVLFDPVAVDEMNIKTNNTMKPEIIYRKPIKIVGKTIETTCACESDFSCEASECRSDVAEFRSRICSDEDFSSIPNRVDPDACLGVALDCCVGDKFTYLCGVEVTSFEGVPESFERIDLDGGKYAKVTVKSSDVDELCGVWEKLYGEWLPGSGYTHAAKADIEYIRGECGSTACCGNGGEEAVKSNSESDLYLQIEDKA